MASPDLSAPIYAALTGNSAIANALATYEGAAAVFTRRPIPADCTYPLVISAGDVTRGNQDLINSPIQVIERDVSIYGLQPADYRTVETVALAVRDLFHRQRRSLIVPGWSVLDIVCGGPIAAPVDDDQQVGRLVTLTVRLSGTL